MPMFDLVSNVLEFIISGNVLWPAEFARLGHSKYWCSKTDSQKEGEWIQVDLGSVRKIYGIGVKVKLLLETQKSTIHVQ